MDASAKKRAMEEARGELSALFESAKSGNVAGMEAVVSRADDRSALSAYRDGNRRHVLHFAAISDSDEAINWVLKEAAGLLDIMDESGTTPIALAASRGLSGACSLLLNAGARLYADAAGATPLHRAAQSGNTALVEFFVRAGCDVNAKAKASGTPLHWASGDESGGTTVETLLLLGADASATDGRGLTPLILAAAVGNAKAVVALANAGADAGLMVSGGATVAHICADAGDATALEAILDKCTNGIKAARATDAEGRNAADAAMAADRQECLRVLEHRGIQPTGVISERGAVSTDVKPKQSMQETTQKSRVSRDAAKAIQYKNQGNTALAAGDHRAAITAYSQAIDFDATNKVFYSNRAAAVNALVESLSPEEVRQSQSLLEQAVADADLCIEIDPDWPKGYFRKGNALLLLQRFEDAAHAFWDALRLDSNNDQLKAALQDAVDKGRKAHQQVSASSSSSSSSSTANQGQNFKDDDDNDIDAATTSTSSHS